MSDFYVAGDLPIDDITVKQGRVITKWCEDEIEAACRDLASHAEVFDDQLKAGESLGVHVYIGGNWDIQGTESKPLYEIIRDIAGSISRGVYPAPIWPDDHRSALEEGLKEIEAVIAEVREQYADDPNDL